ncbi:hypothetical protein FGB62_32g244 [Gracilaria domingensis]|nr:hypothetical protein FGB62_32g244 [Gracilaria domingensis]
MGPLKWLFLLVTFNHAFAQTFCTSPIDLGTFLTRSFRANVDLIRMGVPSEIVKMFYDKAVMDVTLSCNCSSSTIDQTCVSLFFTETMEVAYLRDLLDIDLFAEEPGDRFRLLQPGRKLFPLFRPNLTLHGLSVSQTEELNKGLDHLLLSSKSVVNIQSRYWQRSRFPSDEEFFQDTFEAQKAACDAFQAIENLTNLTFPAWGATTYVVGLVLEVRKARGNLTAAMMMLADHTSLVFNGLRCYRVSGFQLGYPVSKMEQYLVTTQKLLDETSTVFKPDLNDIRQISTIPSMYYSHLVTTFSSLSSSGDGKTTLVSDGTIIRRESVSSILLENLPDTELLSSKNTRQECPDGYILTWRAVPILSLDELCCSEKCELAELSLVDPFSFSVSQEKCCGLCNYFDCTDHTLLPESTPLQYTGTPTLISI